MHTEQEKHGRPMQVFSANCKQSSRFAPMPAYCTTAAVRSRLTTLQSRILAVFKICRNCLFHFDFGIEEDIYYID